MPSLLEKLKQQAPKAWLGAQQLSGLDMGRVRENVENPQLLNEGPSRS